MHARWLFKSHLTSILHGQVSPSPHQSSHMRWLFKSHLTSILCGQVSPPPYQSSHMRCTWDDFSNLTSHPSCMVKCPLHHTKVLTWDDFSNLTSHPSCMAKCPLHHTKVLTWDAREMTFQISPHVHLAWPSVPFQDGCEVRFEKSSHVRTLVWWRGHLTMQDGCEVRFEKSSHVHLMWELWYGGGDTWPHKMDKCPLHHTKVLTWDAREMTFQISPRIHLAWLSVPFTTPKFSHEMTFQISPHIHLAWPSVPSTTCKVTSHNYFSPCVTILISRPPCVSPPHKNNIFHLTWKNSQKSHAATPISSIRYLLRATNYYIYT